MKKTDDLPFIVLFVIIDAFVLGLMICSLRHPS